MKLDLGCGKNKHEGFIGVDKRDIPGVDIIQDLEQGLPNIASNSCSEILASHVMEHIHDIFPLMKDCHRVLRNEGKMTILVPSPKSPYFFGDPTHVKFYGLSSFSTFFGHEGKGMERADYGVDYKFKTVENTEQENEFDKTIEIKTVLEAMK